MAVVNRLHDLSEDVPGVLLCKDTRVDDSIKQLATLTKFHYYVNVSIVFKRLIHPGDIRMILVND
jgi:hypothetical protein